MSASPPEGLRWLLPDGDQHVDAWTSAAHWVHANSHTDTVCHDRNHPCYDCWRAAAFALKGAILVGYQNRTQDLADTTAVRTDTTG